MTGLYRLCGSATKKRILREAFERNARSVNLSPDNVPDINVITGKLTDKWLELQIDGAQCSYPISQVC